MDFLEIHDQFYQRVRKFILASIRNESIADDLVQETFLKIQNSLGTLRDPAKISSWIFRIAYHICQDHFRSLKKSPAGEEEAFEELVNFEETSVQKKMEQEEMSRCVQEQLNLLPESLRSVIIFSDVMEFSQQEIGEILGLTVENVKVRLHRARQRLKAILEKKCTFEVDERNILVCEPVEREKRR